MPTTQLCYSKSDKDDIQSGWFANLPVPAAGNDRKSDAFAANLNAPHLPNAYSMDEARIFDCKAKSVVGKTSI
eukprot:5789648-Amphidinium_carterae.1